MRVAIHHQRCQGHGRCYTVAGELFEPDALGAGRVRDGGDIPSALEDIARRAVANCPEQAIAVVKECS